jgi:hypothetical protein
MAKNPGDFHPELPNGCLSILAYGEIFPEDIPCHGSISTMHILNVQQIGHKRDSVKHVTPQCDVCSGV